ncbi:NAD-P-binding protein [Flagelloscypha sp. PMI_526]|nr:NAD-P-binding protein [Flagelloscypha sp. PMI_526]
MSLKPPLVWLITGTNSGFGRRLTQIALSRGDKVIATARSLEKLRAVKFESASKENLHLVQLDVTEGSTTVREKIENAVKESWGKVSVLVNNAGSGSPAIAEEGEEIFRRAMETNFFGVMSVTNAVLPFMRAKKEGVIVTIGSRTAWKTPPNLVSQRFGSYRASKAAVHAWAETLAQEIKPFGLQGLIVAPGAFRTEGIYSNYWTPSNPIPDYNPTRQKIDESFLSIGGTEPGDPSKAMNLLFQFVRQEGAFEGKGFPENGYVYFGHDSEKNLEEACEANLSSLNAWRGYFKDIDIE